MGKFGPNNQKLSVSTEKWYLEQVDRPESDGPTNFFCFGLEKPFLGKFSPKYQNCLFQWRLGIWSNSNMLNSMVMSTFTVFTENTVFWQI